MEVRFFSSSHIGGFCFFASVEFVKFPRGSGRARSLRGCQLVGVSFFFSSQSRDLDHSQVESESFPLVCSRLGR